MELKVKAKLDNQFTPMALVVKEMRYVGDKQWQLNNNEQPICDLG